MNIVYVIFLAIICSISSNTSESPEFVYDMVDAIALSENNNKDILVIFTADWCKYCQVMKQDINDDPQIVSNLIVCYINIDEVQHKNTIKEFKVKTIPDYCIIRKKIEIKRSKGYTTKNKFIQWLKNAN